MPQSPPLHTFSSQDIKHLHQTLMEMLLEIDRICRKNDIQYILDGGTLLGAIREKGFISWDYDADIVMMRNEYERFKLACQTDLDHSRFFLQDHISDPNYPWGYPRLLRKNSVFERAGYEHIGMKNGIFVDIFPRDNVPDNFLVRAIFNFRCFMLRKLLYAEGGTVDAKVPFMRCIYRLLAHIPRRKTFKTLSRMAVRQNKRPSAMVRTYTMPILPKKVFGYRREWFENLREVDFEGHVFYAPRDYDGYLRCLYGDYMTPTPPQDQHFVATATFRAPDEAISYGKK